MCNLKTLIKIALGISLLLIVGYVVFPEFQTRITEVGPYLLFLACPLAMYFMIKGMNNPPQEKKKRPDQDEP